MAEAKARSCGGGEIKRHWSRSLLDRRDAVIEETGAVSAVWVVGLELSLWSSNWSSVCSCSLFLSLSLSFFACLKLGPEMV